ncbi:hypothetical protein OPV22_025967 [Ensete ventricosum]|uniref:Uncharacterized protein n=1 Tax=Ensete ventricosum TaxID=4639 RepID=A0AAV8QEI4_ENSVE|nr:hypothetical protein OPV22_025967 [Ensete ventricosum]
MGQSRKASCASQPRTLQAVYGTDTNNVLLAATKFKFLALDEAEETCSFVLRNLNAAEEGFCFKFSLDKGFQRGCSPEESYEFRRQPSASILSIWL